MIFCGIKITHDGGIALIEDGNLLFSIELEKVNNNDRYSGIKDLSVIPMLLKSKGYSMDQIDHFVIDGWHEINAGLNTLSQSEIAVLSDGKEIKIPLATYNEKRLQENNLEALEFTQGLVIDQVDYPYLSYRHVTGHILGTYCASPFSQSAEPSYVLVWDGGQHPRLYYVDPVTKSILNKGTLFFLTGTLYGIMGHYFGPYKKTQEELLEDQKRMEFDGYFGGLSIAGKLMSYIAYGTINEELLEALPKLYKTNLEMTVLFEHKLCRAIANFVENKNCTDADVLLTIHTYLQEQLITNLKKKITKDAYPLSNFCFTGGSALNIKWNSAIRDTGMFKAIFVPPFPNDSGSAIGTACAAMWRFTENLALHWHPYVGPDIVATENVPAGWESEEYSLTELARLLHETQEPIAFITGSAEIGPRALGNRSLLAVATSMEVKARLNKIKKREPFRPVAPICLLEDAAEVFDPGCEDPYMLFEHQVRAEWADKVPAIRHLDGSARLQTVSASSKASEIRILLEEYKKISGIPLLCNTSANYNGKGFFADVASACLWGGVNYVWSNNRLYSKLNQLELTNITNKANDEY